jgi:putative hemolysin
MTNPLTLAAVPQPVRWLLNSLSRLPVLRAWYDEWLAGEGGDANAFLNFTLAKTGVQFQVFNEERLAELPRPGSDLSTSELSSSELSISDLSISELSISEQAESNNPGYSGAGTGKKAPLIFVANHPLGGLEGMLLSRLLLTYRQDLKVLTNQMLLSFKEFNELFIGVDVLNPNRAAQNAKGMRRVAKHLSDGGALLVFPAGTVAGVKLNNWTVSEAPWQSIVGRLAQKYKATCVPINVSGENSRLFYLSGLLHPRLRTLLLPRAMISKQGKLVSATIGQPIVLDETEMNAETGTEYLRLNCELLANPAYKNREESGLKQKILDCDSRDLEQVDQYLNTVGQHRLLSRGEFDVYSVPFNKLGPLVNVLAIERERAFREVGEGTGMASDLDRFDSHYDHIFVWDNQQKKLVGSYRAVNTETIVKRFGLKGLYSYSLFDYDQRFLQSLGGAIEIGRSFVAKEYQKNSRALDLLWCGLGGYMLRNPECHTLFGCVSISQTFAPIVRALLVDTLLAGHAADSSTRALVKATTPLAFRNRFWSSELVESLSSMAAINKLLGRVNYQFRVPALIRHYLALNGKFVDFSVNTGFNCSLDGLIFMDLRQAPARYLKRYLGEQGAELFNERWSCKNVA